MVRRARELRALPALLAVLAALLSYACIGGCQRSLLSLVGHPQPLGTLVGACFVSTVANRSIRSGGATGYALLAWLVGRRGVPASAVLSSTAGFLLLTNSLFAGMFVASVPVAAVSLGGGGPRAPLHRAHGFRRGRARRRRRRAAGSRGGQRRREADRGPGCGG